MFHTERLRTFYLFTVIAACCVLITGCPETECTVDCPQPEDVECHDLSVLALESTTVCTDGNEPQVCMARESDNCGYVVNSQYLPCKSCLDCDATIDLVVMLCESSSPAVETSPND